MSSEAGVWLRLVAAIGALALGVAAVVIVAVLAHRTPGPVEPAAAQPVQSPPSGSTTQESAPSSPAFPAPPQNSVVFSRANGSDVLALAVVPGRKLGLQASVLNGQGGGETGLDVAFRVDGAAAKASPCGDGCYDATLTGAGAPRVVEVDVKRPGRTTSWRVPMPHPWPPRDATSLVARTTRTFKKLHTLRFSDSLGSGVGTPTRSHWTVVAPNRLTYVVENGPSAVIIGSRRWDKLPGGKWEESPQTPVHQPTPFWVTWKNAHVVGETKSQWHVTFFDPKTPGWYDVLIDKRSRLPRDMQMHATAHFMRQTYSGFDEPIRIVPPK